MCSLASSTQLYALHRVVATPVAGLTEWRGDDVIQNNPLKNAPHTARAVLEDEWDRPYPRSLAAYPSSHVRHHKFWPHVGRVDNVWGDRNLVCSCPPMEAYMDSDDE